MLSNIISAVREVYSGEVAKNDVIAISRHHRIQASPGYRAAAGYVLEQLKEAGLEAEIETYPADYRSRFWTSHSFQEWAASGATLHLIEPADSAQKLADYRENKISLIQRSIPFSSEVEIVLLEDGLEEIDYEGLEIAGKMVLTRGAVSSVHQLAVKKYGAIGILFDGMNNALPVREPMDLPDDRQYTSFWWTGRPDEKQCFGFVLSPRQGAWLRGVIRQREKEGLAPVKVRAAVDTSFYDGEIEVVTAVIPGQGRSRRSGRSSESGGSSRSGKETVIMASHLCHPQPSANDNASGAAANLEIARTLHKLISTGKLPQPRRTIRFLWMPEMTGSYAYLARHEGEIPDMIAGLNLDMVGEDQMQTGSVLLLERPPDAAASFAPDLLERLQELIFDDVKSYTGLDKYSLFRYTTTGFSGGSDHYIFSDPTVGVPMPMLIQWPDKFYHTTADTPDKVDPRSLAKVGVLAGAYAYFIASAGQVEAAWLAQEMYSAFQIRMTKMIQNYMTAALEEKNGDGDGGSGRSGGSNGSVRKISLQARVNYGLDRYMDALKTLEKLSDSVGSLVAHLVEDANKFASQTVARTRSWEKDLPLPGKDDGREVEDDEDEAAAGRIFLKSPKRQYRGPVSGIGAFAALPAADIESWSVLVGSRKAVAFTIPSLAEYWADGERTLAEVIDLVEMETGVRDEELIVRYFDLLQKLELVAVQ